VGHFLGNFQACEYDIGGSRIEPLFDQKVAKKWTFLATPQKVRKNDFFKSLDQILSKYVIFPLFFGFFRVLSLFGTFFGHFGHLPRIP
jgi:hypothetical protein